MKTIECIAIDDEPMALLVIEQFCRRKGGMKLLTYSEPHAGLEEIRRSKPDLVFLDIQMNSISGLEIADLLPDECCFIFTTAHAQYALDGFNLDAVDFLHKPFAYERFEVAVDKALRRIEQKQKKADTQGFIVVKQEYNNVNIALDEIMYIEALGNYIKIHRTGKSHVLSRTNMKAIQTMLPPQTFVRIHRSFIVAVPKVEEFTKTHLKLKGCDKTLPIGDCYSQQVDQMLKDRKP